METTTRSGPSNPLPNRPGCKAWAVEHLVRDFDRFDPTDPPRRVHRTWRFGADFLRRSLANWRSAARRCGLELYTDAQIDATIEHLHSLVPPEPTLADYLDLTPWEPAAPWLVEVEVSRIDLRTQHPDILWAAKDLVESDLDGAGIPVSALDEVAAWLLLRLADRALRRQDHNDRALRVLRLRRDEEERARKQA